ncbi:MAG: hypothetical protein CK424_04125 [Legionella sp.]|nr:MAG: hypothetical protein CK424_04125 [Legionella sp.]
MYKLFQKFITVYLCAGLCMFSENAHTAIDQILNDNFFQNPAELSLITNFQILGGNVFISPEIKFIGTTNLGSGHATSDVNDFLPYILVDYRVSDKWVFGVNIVPSAYGHLEWPIDSIVAQDATVTDVLYYRYGLQSSYQITDTLSLGIGANLQANEHYELDFVVSGLGNELNNVSGFNFIADVGLHYKITSRHSLSIAYYSPVNNKKGHGRSVLHPNINNNFTLNINEASVAFIGLEHCWTPRWSLEEKVYWSGWSIQKNIYFNNTTRGSFVIPTNYKDTLSFLFTTKYSITDKTVLIGGLLYETNPVPIETNAIGYPLAAFGAITSGFSIVLQNELSMQFIYSYGKFLPNSPINNSGSIGTITANVQAAVLQVMYKI